MNLMMRALRVAQWCDAHETSESRKILNLPWYRKPNKHDGRGYRRMAAQEDREALYGAWIAILDVVCKGPRAVRGWLVRDAKPLDAEALADMTGFRQTVFERALVFFKEEPMCWLVEDEFSPATLGASAGPSGESPGTLGATAGVLGKSSGQRRGEERREDQGKKKGGGVAASRTQFAALRAEISELEKRYDDLTIEERSNLRKKRADLKALQARQAKGDF